MRIALSQNNFHIGNFDFNKSKIINRIIEAKESGAELIIFPELAVSGYPPLDFVQYKNFISRCYSSIEEISSHCKDIAAIVGSPAYNNDKGKPLFNSAFFLSEGTIKGVFHKGLIPNYDVFDEYRYFEPAGNFNIITYKDHRLAVTICEDLWSLDNKTLYTASPMEELIKQKPELIINIAASPFSYNQHIERKSILRKNAEKYKLPIIYVNHTGAHTELLFDGGSMTMNAKGQILHEMKYFEEDIHFTSIESLQIEAKDEANQPKENDKIKLIHDGLIMGVRDYFNKSGFDKAILGLSGGLDSAVTAVLAAKALGNSNVKALLMPSPFSSDHSVDDAVELAKNLKISYEIIPINNAYNTFIDTLNPYFNNLPFDTTEENIQARIRAILLMAYSNKYGNILLNTSNKSEAAVGYGTLYGDMCGGLSVIGDVYKSDAVKLAEYINRTDEIIPLNTITKPPSAELKPDQKDSDSLPEYDLLDKILYEYIELQNSPADIISKGYEANVVDRIISLVNKSEHKRFQTPPILRVSPKAFGMGRRIPVVAKYLV